MPANLLIFDADYISELTSRMNTACGLFADAVSSLRSACSHENWKCKERARIIESFDELNTKLNSLDRGVNETTRILSGSVSRFAALENKYDSQANNLSDELTSNHGFSASVRTSGTEAGTSTAGAAGASAAGALGSSSEQAAGPADKNAAGAGTGSGTGGFHIHAGGRMSGSRPGENINTGPGKNTASGGGQMNINLPVTHIPDNPGAAARGTKDTQEIADAALNSVISAMTEALSSPSDARTAAHLARTYNAGRSIFESSAAILASPSQPHTSERLAMAAGIVALSQNTGGNNSVSASAHVNITQNAGIISSELEGNNEASELRTLLAFLTGGETSSGSSASSSGGVEMSFFDTVAAELRKEFYGGGESVSASGKTSLASSSPVMEFLGKFVMEQAV